MASSTPTSGKASGARSSPRIRLIVVGVAISALLVVIAIIIASVVRNSGSGSSRAETSVPAIFFGAVDDFGRSDSSTSLGTAETGQKWLAVRGTWGVTDQQAYVAQPKPKGYSLAVLNVRTGNETLQVTMPRVATGSGVVFRFRNEFNYWMITASPKVATWVVQKVVSGNVTTVGSIGVAPAANGTTISIQMRDADLNFSVNGRLRKNFQDSELAAEQYAGLVGFGKEAGEARWTNFVVSGQATSLGTAPSATPTPGSVESSTTTSGG
jgi:hypothetical protein